MHCVCTLGTAASASRDCLQFLLNLSLLGCLALWACRLENGLGLAAMPPPPSHVWSPEGKHGCLGGTGLCEAWSPPQPCKERNPCQVGNLLGLSALWGQCGFLLMRLSSSSSGFQLNEQSPAAAAVSDTAPLSFPARVRVCVTQ